MNCLIVTHPGKAHFDEFLAISFILAVHDTTHFRIERRDPTPAELNDPETWVVDIGHRYEPELKNFDHHQDLSLGASFVLVADYLRLTQKFDNASWWAYKDRMDRFGPNNLGREMGIESLTPTISPFENWFLTLFETSPILVYHLMQLFGRSLIDKADKLIERLRFWESCEKVRIKNRIVIIGLTDDSEGSQEYRDQMEEPAVASVIFDSRGDGWRLYRFNDLPGVDFSRLETHPQVEFAHKGGFIAKTRDRLPLPEVLGLLELAID